MACISPVSYTHLDVYKRQPLDKALAILQYTPKAASELLYKLVKSAAANAENNFNMDKNSLYVAECYVCLLYTSRCV